MKSKSKYTPHQGKQEMARRVKQLKKMPISQLRKVMLNEEHVQKVLEKSLEVFQ